MFAFLKTKLWKRDKGYLRGVQTTKQNINDVTEKDKQTTLHKTQKTKDDATWTQQQLGVITGAIDR